MLLSSFIHNSSTRSCFKHLYIIAQICISKTSCHLYQILNDSLIFIILLTQKMHLPKLILPFQLMTNWYYLLVHLVRTEIKINPHQIVFTSKGACIHPAIHTNVLWTCGWYFSWYTYFNTKHWKIEVLWNICHGKLCKYITLLINKKEQQNRKKKWTNAYPNSHTQSQNLNEKNRKLRYPQIETTEGSHKDQIFKGTKRPFSYGGNQHRN